MNISDKNKLSGLIDKTIDILEEYIEETKPLAEEDFNKLECYLDNRNALMQKLRGIYAEEKQVISAQDDKDILSEIFMLKKLDESYSGDTAELARKLRAEKILYDRIESIEKLVDERFSEAREMLDKDFAQLNKTKQVIDYMEQTAKPEIFRGVKFDKSL